jgi:hypothetical protein
MPGPNGKLSLTPINAAREFLFSNDIAFVLRGCVWRGGTRGLVLPTHCDTQAT